MQGNSMGVARNGAQGVSVQNNPPAQGTGYAATELGRPSSPLGISATQEDTSSVAPSGGNASAKMDPLLEMLIVTQNTSDANKEKMQVDISQNPTVNGGNESGYKPASIGAPTSMVNAVEPAASTYTPKAIEPETPTGTVTQSGANHKNNMTVRKPQAESNFMGAAGSVVEGGSDAKTDVPLKTDNANGTLNSNDARVQKALEMRKNGATNSQINAEIGLISMANGSLQDGIGGPIVWSGIDGTGSNRRNVQGAEAVQGQRVGAAEGQDRRGPGGDSLGDLSRRRTGEGREKTG